MSAISSSWSCWHFVNDTSEGKLQFIQFFVAGIPPPLDNWCISPKLRLSSDICHFLRYFSLRRLAVNNGSSTAWEAAEQVFIWLSSFQQALQISLSLSIISNVTPRVKANRMQVLIEQMNINQLILPLDTILPELTVYLAWKVPTTSVRSLEKMMRILLLLVWGTEIDHKSGKRHLFSCLLDYQCRPRIYRVENSER